MAHRRLLPQHSSLSSLRAAQEAAELKAALGRLKAEAGGLHRGLNVPVVREARGYTKTKRSGPSAFEKFLVNSFGSAASGGISSLLDGDGWGGAAEAFGGSLLDSAEQKSSQWLDQILRGQRVR
ncbi:MAG: hypothetical protein ABTQ34_03460 [Bdellovibrionales bacterium]